MDFPRSARLTPLGRERIAPHLLNGGRGRLREIHPKKMVLRHDSAQGKILSPNVVLNTEHFIDWSYAHSVRCGAPAAAHLRAGRGDGQRRIALQQVRNIFG